MTVATEPDLDLTAHLTDRTEAGHSQPAALVAKLDSDLVAEYHDACHATGMPDHCHTDAIP